MVPASDPEPAAGASPADGRRAGYPFRGPGLLARVGPFAAIAVLAEASLALPPGPASTWAAVASVVLLVAVAAAFLLPWSRLPGWMPVLVPLAYTGSVLALILAAGTTSGVGIVILVPLIWTALFGQLWESACVVAAIVAVEVVISLTPVAAPDAVVARRVILWAALGMMLSVATHGLRDRIRRAREQAAQLQDRLHEVSIVEDRDRIAGDLRDKVIQEIFAAGAGLAKRGDADDRPARAPPDREERR
jgi:signal transduction histidine kinase